MAQSSSNVTGLQLDPHSLAEPSIQEQPASKIPDAAPSELTITQQT
jgi:hypothetical protein